MPKSKISKSSHHKNENQYRFLTLAERINNIKADVSKRIKRVNDKSEGTFFYKGLEKWIDLNYSSEFSSFTYEIKTDCVTLEQLLYHKDKIVNNLINCINKVDILSLEPILELTVELARDLELDFYAYFPRFFHSIVNLLDTQDTQVLEWSFQCLSSLFIVLWRQMIKDLPNVYDLYSPLFEESRKEHIRSFAAECFAYLMRKVVAKEELFEFMFDRLVKHPQEANGIGKLIFEMFKNINNQFNSLTEHGLRLIVDKLESAQNEETNELFSRTIDETVKCMANYTNKQHSSVIWNVFYAKIDENIHNSNKSRLTQILKLIQTMLSIKNCYLVDDLDKLCVKLVDVAKFDHENLNLTQNLFDIIKIMAKNDKLNLKSEKFQLVLSVAYSNEKPLSCIVDLTRNLYDFEYFNEFVLPKFFSYTNANADLTECLDEFVLVLSDFLLEKEFVSLFSKEFQFILENRSEKSDRLCFLKEICKFKDLTAFLKIFKETRCVKLIEKLIHKAKFNLNCSMMVILPFVMANTYNEEVMQVVTNTKNSLLIDSNQQEEKSLLLSVIIWSEYLIDSIGDHNSEEIITRTSLVLTQIKDSDNLNLVLNLMRALDFMVTFKQEFYFTIDECTDLFEMLKNQLQSPYHFNRLLALNLLTKFKNDIMQENVITTCLQAEEEDLSIERFRDKQLYLERLDYDISKKLIPGKEYQDVALKYFLGLLHENFKLLWTPVKKLIQSYANGLPRDEFWNVFWLDFNSVTRTIELKRSEKKVDESSDEDLSQKSIDYLKNNAFRVDYMNKRHLLLECMQEISNKCEQKTRDIIPVFFRFIENEYFSSEFRILSNLNEDITKRDIEPTEEILRTLSNSVKCVESLSYSWTR